MIRISDHLTLTLRLTPTEAHMLVMAWWEVEPTDERRFYRVEGHVVGPFCEYSETLTTKSPLHPDPLTARIQPLRSRACILEPCFWEPQHPFFYEVILELYDEVNLLDMRRFIAGIRHLAVAERELLLNGQEVFLKGVRHKPEATIEELAAWHEVECSALLVTATEGLCGRTDRWGPMVLHVLPRTKEEAREHVVKLRNNPSVLLWILPPRIHGRDLDELVSTIKAHDPSRPIGQLVAIDEPILAKSARPVDLFFLPAGHWAIGSTELNKPYAVLADTESDPDISQFENFTNQTVELCHSLGSPPGLVGVIL